MGNRHSEGEPISIINPPEHPYLHIIRTRAEDDSYGWDYVAHLSGLKISVTHSDIGKNRERDITLLADFDIPLLPKIVTVPPPPINTRDLVDSALEKRQEELIESLLTNPSANLLTFTHGYGWGLYPIEVTARLLDGLYKVHTNGVFQIGGRKKFQVNAVDIQKL